MPKLVNRICYYFLYRYLNTLYGQTQYPSKSWVLKCLFPFKVRQHSQQQLNLQYKVGWILYKMASAPSFYTTLPVHTNTISKKSFFVYFSQFSLPYMITKPPLQSPPALLFPIPQPFFTSLFLHIVISTILTKKVFPYHLASSGCIKGPMSKSVLTLRADTVTSLPTFPSMA